MEKNGNYDKQMLLRIAFKDIYYKNCIKRYILHDIPLSCKDIIHAKVLYSYSSGTYNYMYYFSI